MNTKLGIIFQPSDTAAAAAVAAIFIAHFESVITFAVAYFCHADGWQCVEGVGSC